MACIGGDEEIVQLLLSKLEDDIGRTFTYDMLHEFFEMPFVVSMDFQDYKCAKQLMDYMNDKIGSIVSLLLYVHLLVITSLSTGCCVYYS